MEQRAHISLDNPVFRGRLRLPRTRPVVRARSQPSYKSRIADIRVVLQNSTTVTPKQNITNPKTAHHQIHTRPGMPKQARSSVLKRQFVNAPHAKSRKHKLKGTLVPKLMTAMAVVLFVAGILVVLSSLRTNHTVTAQVKQLAKQTVDNPTVGPNVPSEDPPPKNLGAYSVAPDLPKLLTIDKINVNARIRSLGVNTEGVMKAPTNIFDIGWYDSSAKPGQPGAIVLDGHVSGPTKHGVFYDIGKLKPGDKVKLTRGDNKVFTYTVTGTKVYNNNDVDMAKVMTSSVAGKPGLNFMTCTGKFNAKTNQFEQRVVVFSTQD